MRRNHTLQDLWMLALDCPLNNSISDISGNNNNLSAVAGGTPTFITDPTDFNIKVGQFTSDNHRLLITTLVNVNWINKFKLEVDFYKYSTWTNVSYPNMIDGSASGGHNGIETQRVNASMYWGLVNAGSGYFLTHAYTTLSVNTWFHYSMIILNNLMTIVITRNSDNALIHNYSVTVPTVTSVPYPIFCLGGSIYQDGRQWGGYMKNFKLYI